MRGLCRAGRTRARLAKSIVVFLLAVLSFFLFLGVLQAAPKADLWSKWLAPNDKNRSRVDHGSWDRFLKTYVDADHPSGINRVRYARVTAEDRKALEEYLKGLQSIQVSGLNPDEQKAFWINLYDALPVKLILDYYPVRTIRDIDISPGWFQDGPWAPVSPRWRGKRWH